jgi:hypothetical protein
MLLKIRQQEAPFFLASFAFRAGFTAFGNPVRRMFSDSIVDREPHLFYSGQGDAELLASAWLVPVRLDIAATNNRCSPALK